MDFSQPSIDLLFRIFIRSLNGRIECGKRTGPQRKTGILIKQGVKTKKNKGAVEISEKSEFPVTYSKIKKIPRFSRKVSSPWQGPIIIASRRVFRFEAVVWSVLYRILFRISPRVLSLKHEQREVAVHLLRSKNVVTILPTGFGKILIY